VTSKTPDPNNIDQHGESPHWSWTTKLVVGLALVAIFLLLLVRFQSFLGPLITAILLAYLINPIAKFACEKIKIPWRISVTIIYLLLVLIILGLTTWGGFALVDQVQNLIGFIEKNIFQLPDLVAEITERTYEIGPFTFTPTGLSWDEITNEIVRAIQPAIGRLGTLVGSIAAGAVNIITWTVLIVLISYFLLAESAGFPGQMFDTDITGQREDMQRMSRELNRIWRAFIRGELLIVLISYVIYTILLGIMGVQFFVGLAAVAALGQLIPYLGAWATWVSFGLVALFQTNVPFDLPSGVYMLIVLGVSMVINNVIDNIIRTKIMASGLKVHPSLVLIGAIIGVQLFGFIGIVIAAPIMASFKLFLTYVIRKLGDQDPWEEREAPQPLEETQWAIKSKKVWLAVKAWIVNQWQVIKAWIVEQWKALRQKPPKKTSEKTKTQSNPPPPSDEK
jgi:predicted PurR-regulated permease PerM